MAADGAGVKSWDEFPADQRSVDLEAPQGGTRLHRAERTGVGNDRAGMKSVSVYERRTVARREPATRRRRYDFQSDMIQYGNHKCNTEALARQKSNQKPTEYEFANNAVKRSAAHWLNEVIKAARRLVQGAPQRGTGLPAGEWLGNQAAAAQ
jgi:hypothetical protein